MKRIPVPAIWISALSVFVYSHTALADMDDCDSKQIAAMKAGLEESKRFEAKGDYETAYKRVHNLGFCEFEDKVLTNELETAEKRLGPKAASQMEDKNPGEACKIYQEYSNKSNHHKYTKDADRAIIKHAKTVPVDHPGIFLACTPSDDTKVIAELSALASRNAEKILETEASSFKAFEKEAALLEIYDIKDKFYASKELLRNAYSWHDNYLFKNKAGAAKVKETAIKHGDTLQAHSDLTSLHFAIEYYSIFGSKSDKNDDQIMAEHTKAVRIKASGLGDDLMKNKDYQLAVKYFDIAGERKKKEEALRLIKEIENEKIEEKKAANVKETKRKKDFKKDTDAFEKELGM